MSLADFCGLLSASSLRRPENWGNFREERVFFSFPSRFVGERGQFQEDFFKNEGVLGSENKDWGLLFHSRGWGIVWERKNVDLESKGSMF